MSQDSSLLVGSDAMCCSSLFKPSYSRLHALYRFRSTEETHYRSNIRPSIHPLRHISPNCQAPARPSISVSTTSTASCSPMEGGPRKVAQLITCGLLFAVAPFSNSRVLLISIKPNVQVLTVSHMFPFFPPSLSSPSPFGSHGFRSLPASHSFV